MVVVVPIFVVNKASPPMPQFQITHINKTKSMFLQYFKFSILVYIPTKISLCNHMPQFENNVHPVVMLEHVGKSLLTLYITYMYAYWIFVEYLRYKVLIYFCAGYLSKISYWYQLLFHIIPTPPSNRVTDLYAYCKFVEYLCYKVLLFCLCGSFGGNRLLIWTTLSYNINSSIQGGCQFSLKRYITDLYAYCISVESLCYKVLIYFLSR